MATTWRADVRAAHVAILEDQKAATPTLLRKVHPTRPGSFGDLPAAFVSSIPETVTHDAGTRTRVASAEVTLVDSYAGDNTQGSDRMDDLVDALVDRYDLSTSVQRVPSSVIQLTAITDVDITIEGALDKPPVNYRGVVLTFGQSSKLEGRD